MKPDIKTNPDAQALLADKLLHYLNQFQTPTGGLLHEIEIEKQKITLKELLDAIYILTDNERLNPDLPSSQRVEAARRILPPFAHGEMSYSRKLIPLQQKAAEKALATSQPAPADEIPTLKEFAQEANPPAPEPKTTPPPQAPQAQTPRPDISEALAPARPIINQGITQARSAILKRLSSTKLGAKALELFSQSKGAIAKLGTKALAKLGLTTAFKALSGVASGGVLLALEAGRIVLSKLKKVFNSLTTGLITKIAGISTEGKGKWAALLSMGAIGMGAITGSVVLFGAGVLIGGTTMVVGGTAAFTGAITMTFVAVSAIVVPPIMRFVIFVIAVLVATVIFTAFVIFVINSGAYIVPPGAPLTDPEEIGSGNVIESKYIGINKSPNPNYAPDPVSVKYTISISATTNKLTNIQLSDRCTAYKNEGNVDCPGFTIPTPPAEINPGSPFTFELTVDYGSEYDNSTIINTFTVVADVENGPSGEKAANYATVVFGTPPTLSVCDLENPGVPPAPVGIRYSADGQYAFPVAPLSRVTYSCTHHNNRPEDTLYTGNATDITVIGVGRSSPIVGLPIVAYTSGVVNTVATYEYGGKAIILAGDDNRYYYYAHNCVIYPSEGQRVSVGDVLGRTDRTGNAQGTAEHLHFNIGSTPDFTNGSDICAPRDFKEKFGFERCSTMSCYEP
jgi:hypothetical protein